MNGDYVELERLAVSFGMGGGPLTDLEKQRKKLMNDPAALSAFDGMVEFHLKYGEAAKEFSERNRSRYSG